MNIRYNNSSICVSTHLFLYRQESALNPKNIDNEESRKQKYHPAKVKRKRFTKPGRWKHQNPTWSTMTAATVKRTYSVERTIDNEHKYKLSKQHPIKSGEFRQSPKQCRESEK